jgi:hypothetical protein
MQHGEASLAASGALAALGLNLLKQKRHPDAEVFLRECLTIREGAIPDHWSMFNTKSMLGDALLGRKNYDDAEELLVTGYYGMKQREDSIPPQAVSRLTEAVERLVQLYEATGDTDKADEWRARLFVLKPATAAEPRVE